MESVLEPPMRTPSDGGAAEAVFVICSVFAMCPVLHKPHHHVLSSPQPHGGEAVILPHLKMRIQRLKDRPGLELGLTLAC